MTADSTLSARIQALKDEREAVLAEIALIKHRQPSSRKVSARQVSFAMEKLKAMLLDPSLGYGKQLLRFLVDDIRVEVGQMTVSGPVASLEQAVNDLNQDTVTVVPRFLSDWRPRHESNV